MQPFPVLAVVAASALLVTGAGSIPALAGPDSAPTAPAEVGGDRHRGHVQRATGDRDIVGVIIAFDNVVLTVAGVAGHSSTSVVNRRTEIHVEGAPSTDGSLVHLAPGVAVADIEVNGRTGRLEEIRVYPRS